MQTGDGPDVAPAAAPKRIGPIKFTRFSNAYMLVYVRERDWPRFMCPLTKDDIAPYLREWLEEKSLFGPRKPQGGAADAMCACDEGGQ